MKQGQVSVFRAFKKGSVVYKATIVIPLRVALYWIASDSKLVMLR